MCAGKDAQTVFVNIYLYFQTQRKVQYQKRSNMSPNLEGFSLDVVSPFIHRDLTRRCNCTTMQENPILVLQSMITEHELLLDIETHLPHPGQINRKNKTDIGIVIFFPRCKKVLIPSGSDQFSHASREHFVNFPTAGISLYS